MRLSNRFIITVLGLIAANGIYAAAPVATTPTDPILAPGTRIVAGDVAQNEFYILDKNEKDPVIKQDQAKVGTVRPTITTAENKSSTRKLR